MALVRWQPERDVLWNVQRKVGNLFDDLMRRPLLGDRTEHVWMPEVDVTEHADQFIVSMDLPGMSREEVNVSVEGSTLTVRGERKQVRREETDNYHLNERRYGTFRRAFTLPQTIDGNKVRAEYQNGVLEVTLSKAEEARAREISIDVK